MEHQAIGQSAATLHADSIVIDAACPLLREFPKYLTWYREGGVTAVAPTVGGTSDARKTLNTLATWHRLLQGCEDLLLVRQAQDIETAKRSGRLGVFLHFEGTDPIEDDLDLVHVYKALGVGLMQLTYNLRSRAGDGSEERTDSGLSRFGVKLVEHLNEARVIVDCSHTGLRTSLEAIEHSNAPVVLSHSNAAAVQACPRNAPNELIDAIAQSGGVVGVCGFPPMVADTRRPSADQFIAHIDAIAERAGIEHVGLGLDYCSAQDGILSDEEAARRYKRTMGEGYWNAWYPPPPHHFPIGIETPQTLPTLTQKLLDRGYRPEEIRKVLGGNWLRVIRKVWG